MGIIARILEIKKQAKPHMVECEAQICRAIKAYSLSGPNGQNTMLIQADSAKRRTKELGVHLLGPFPLMQAEIGLALQRLERETRFNIEAVDITLDPVSCRLRIGRWF